MFLTVNCIIIIMTNDTLYFYFQDIDLIDWKYNRKALVFVSG